MFAGRIAERTPHSCLFRRRWALLLGASLLTACGNPGPPHPPSLKLPNPAKDLSVSRNGDVVTLHWTMTKRTTDKVTLKGPQRAHICRILETGPCQTAGDLRAEPDKPAQFTDTLPSQLTSGPPRLLTYYVELQSPTGKTAGRSNPAYTAAGTAPQPLTGLEASPRADGIVLHWNPAPAQTGMILRLHRTMVATPGLAKPGKANPGSKSAVKTQTGSGGKSSEASGVPTATEQTLAVPLSAADAGRDPGHALDRDASLDHTYTYTGQRVLPLTLDKHVFEIAGAASAPVTIDAKDVFPPAIPGDLAAVADTQGRAIDLSWSPDTERDLAGYFVYRREAASNAAPVRISSSRPQLEPSFHDTTAQPGIRYAYSVSAVDQDGNESARSPEAKEILSPP